MKNHHLIIEFHEGTPIAAHWLPRWDYGCPGWYIKTTSFNAFSERNLKRLRKAHQKGLYDLPVRFSVYRCFPDGSTESAWIAEMVIKGLPYYTHKELFEFYKSIGYDHKRNKLPSIESRKKLSGTSRTFSPKF